MSFIEMAPIVKYSNRPTLYHSMRYIIFWLRISKLVATASILTFIPNGYLISTAWFYQTQIHLQSHIPFRLFYLYQNGQFQFTRRQTQLSKFKTPRNIHRYPLMTNMALARALSAWWRMSRDASTQHRLLL